MKRIALICLILPAAAIGDDPFACVDPEFTDAFLGNAYVGRPTYSTDVPAAFTGLQVPESFSLIGSEISSHSVRVIYKTDESAEAAVSAAVKRIAGDEWRDLPDIMRMPRGGFQNRAIPRMARLCRDTEPGLLSINASDADGRTYLSYAMSSYGEGQTCSAMESQSTMLGRRAGMGFWDKLPQLNLPDDTQSTSAGMGGGGNEYHSDIIVSSGMNRDILVGYLGDQIRDQGWTFDTGWSGNFSAGSIWSKTSQEDEMLIGILHAYGESPDTYRVRFAVSPAKTGRFSGFNVIGNPAIRLN